MAGAGTGQPNFLRCSNCRSKRKGQYVGGYALTRTGRVRKRKGTYYSGAGRMLHEKHEYRCKDCGHVGWTAHVAILRRPLQTSEKP